MILQTLLQRSSVEYNEGQILLSICLCIVIFIIIKIKQTRGKHNKTFAIACSAVLCLSFFMPWLKFFVSISAWDVLFGEIGKYVNTEFKFLALLIPITGGIIISTEINKVKYPIPEKILYNIPIIVLVLFFIAIASKIDSMGGGLPRSINPSQTGEVLRLFGIGFWLTISASLLLSVIGGNGLGKSFTGINSIPDNKKIINPTSNVELNSINTKIINEQEKPLSEVANKKDEDLSIINQLKQLKQLIDSDIITQQEYEQQKNKILNS